MNGNFDIAVIGAGMAGASIAAELAPHASVVVLEAESQPGYHATGRSAAFWEECYGGPDVVPLTMASGRYLREHGFLTPRGALYVGQEADKAALEAFERRFAHTGVTIERRGRQGLESVLPGVRANWTGAIWQPACADIDVAGLHAHYLARMRRGSVETRQSARVSRLQRRDGGWRLEIEKGETIHARTVVNAAGAWADGIARLAGFGALGIVPFRRTVVQLRTDPPPPADLPLVLDISGRFYFRPDNGRLWLSPHDETPCEPCDAAPEEIDVATAIDRFQRVVDWKVEAAEHKWAGLRSFAPDRLPVYGFDPRTDGFFWFAGQGGFGIQTAPAAGRLAAQLLLGRPRDELTRALDPVLYAPERLIE